MPYFQQENPTRVKCSTPQTSCRLSFLRSFPVILVTPGLLFPTSVATLLYYPLLVVRLDQPNHSADHFQDFKVRNTTSRGGFVYFGLPGDIQQLGASYKVSMTVGTYRGLKPPSFFLSQNALPTLEKYGWTNTTVASADKSDYTWSYRMTNPLPGQYVVGMYLYGTYTRYPLKLIVNL